MATDTTLLLIGCGGHAKVVIDAAEKIGYAVFHIADDDPINKHTTLLGHRILDGDRNMLLPWLAHVPAIAAIGDNAARLSLTEWLLAHGARLTTIIHSAAVVGRGATIGAGSFLAAGAIINSDARLGGAVIINTGASVDHDCVLGDGVHLAPGVHLCGKVSVGAGSLIGVGASVAPGISIGAGCVVGAGATVIDDVTDGVCVIGTPARPYRTQA